MLVHIFAVPAFCAVSGGLVNIEIGGIKNCRNYKILKDIKQSRKYAF